MSLIESCRLNCANPWEYLLTLMRNKKAARRNPSCVFALELPSRGSGRRGASASRLSEKNGGIDSFASHRRNRARSGKPL